MLSHLAQGVSKNALLTIAAQYLTGKDSAFIAPSTRRVQYFYEMYAQKRSHPGGKRIFRLFFSDGSA